MDDVRILIVEDEIILAAEMTSRLEKLGYVPAAHVTYAEEAVSYLEDHPADPPDLVLMDIVLRGRMDGIEAAGRIRDRWGIPVIFVTAYADEARFQRAKVTNPYGYLLKPFQDREVKAAIEMALYKSRMEARLRESEDRFRTIADYTYDWEYWEDPGGGYVWVSPSCERITGHPPERFHQEPDLFFRIMDERDRPEAEPAIRARASSDEFHHRDFRIVRADGRVRWISHNSQPVYGPDGSPRGRRASNRDVTDRKESEKALMDFQHQLRTLASELALAEERERRSIAVDLHDRVGHTLAMCQIKVNQLQAAAGDAETADDLEKVSEWLEAAIGDTRSLIMEISPPALYELGLEAALDELCHDLQQQHHLAAELVDDGADKPLGEDARAAMYRSVRELAINAVKHAHATRLTISVQRDGDRIAVQVADDGVGFDPEAAKRESAHRASYGLFSIGERLSYLGGKMQIDSRPGRGTVVTLEAPLQKPGAGPTGTRRSTQRRGAEVKR